MGHNCAALMSIVFLSGFLVYLGYFYMEAQMKKMRNDFSNVLEIFAEEVHSLIQTRIKKGIIPSEHLFSNVSKVVVARYSLNIHAQSFKEFGVYHGNNLRTDIERIINQANFCSIGIEPEHVTKVLTQELKCKIFSTNSGIKDTIEAIRGFNQQLILHRKKDEEHQGKMGIQDGEEC